MNGKLHSLHAIIFILLALFSAPSLADEGDDAAMQKVGAAMEKAMERLQEKDYDGALAAYALALNELERGPFDDEQKREARQLIHYNSACALSLKGEKEKALDAFEKALLAEFHDFDHISKDKDLDPIRHEARFEAILSKYREKAKESRAKEALREKQEFLEVLSKKEALFPFDFSLTDINGKALKLADLRGQVVLVDVWGTWCPPCRKEVPHLVKLHEKLTMKGFSVVGLNCEQDHGEPMEPLKAKKLVQEFLAKNNVPYRCALIDKEFTRKIPDFEGFPTLLFVDRQGRVRLKQVGYTEEELLEAAAERLLAEAAEVPEPSGKGEAF